ncbi:hyptothetic protein [Streptococcus pneumoniae]|nr:hyptothetic protein [Streptococcus pneumoniae]
MTKTITVDYKKIMELGFTKSTAQQIIRQAKQKMVQQGYTIYCNRRLESVPISAVEEILGFKLP